MNQRAVGIRYFVFHCSVYSNITIYRAFFTTKIVFGGEIMSINECYGGGKAFLPFPFSLPSLPSSHSSLFIHIFQKISSPIFSEGLFLFLLPILLKPFVNEDQEDVDEY